MASDRARTGAAIAAAALLVGAAGGFALGRTTGGGERGAEPGSIEAIAEELTAGQAADRAALSAELARAARTAHDQLGQVLRAMAPVVPVQGAAPADAAAPVTADDAATWVADADRAARILSSVPEGTAEFNVTRQALLTSAHMVSDTAEELSSALAAPGLAPGDVERVAAQRDVAVQLWQAGAEQLDGLVVGAGQEHVHLFLDPSGDPDAVPLEFQEPDAP